MTVTTDTPAAALKAATDENVLPLGGLALVGTVLTPGEKRALIRTASGRIKSVTPGEEIGGAQVAAIESDTLVLSRGGRTTKLKMPKR